MHEPRFDLSGGFHLSPVSGADKAACVAHLADREIADGTLRIPFPYTAQHAEEWLVERIRERVRQENETTFAIREPSGGLIGVIGLQVGAAPHEHRAEFGYWLAKSFWGRGICTKAVAEVVRYAFEELKLSRIYAEVFSTNAASIRVLEKNGFTREGLLRSHFQKNGALIDAAVLGLIKT